MDLNSISSYLKCPLCKTHFDNPKLLPCGHNICEKCLQCHVMQTVRIIGHDIYDFLDDKAPDIRPSETCFKCPIDDKELTPPNATQEVRKWAGQFENNLKIVTLLEICKGKERGLIEYCDICIEVFQKVAATSVCFTCAEKYCVKCAFIHRQTHSKDSLFNLSTIQTLLADDADITSTSAERSETCKIHFLHPITLVCLDCKEKCCRHCKHTTHIECRHAERLGYESEGDFGANISLAQLEDRFKRAITQISDVMKEDLELYNDANELINADNGINSKNFEYMLGELKCQISRWELLHEQTQQSLKCLNEIKQTSAKDLTQQLFQKETECRQIETEIECHKKFKKDNCDRLQKFKDDLHEGDYDTKDSGNVALPNKIDKKLIKTQFDIFDQLIKIKTDCEIKDLTSKVQVVGKTSMYMNDDDIGCWLTDCLFITDGFLIVADKANECIKWKLNDGQVKRLSFKSSPQCLAADKLGTTGCVTLPDDKTIQFFCIKDESINLTHQLLMTEKCYGVDFIDRSWIIVSCKGNPESFVCILNEKGSEVRRFSRNEDEPCKVLFTDPRYLKVRKSGDEFKIYVTDFCFQTVTCITLQSEGEHFTTESIFHDKMGKPLGIDNDDNGNLVVCSNSTGNVQQIVVLNENERQHRLLVESLWMPRAISFLKGGTLFMVTSDAGPCKNHVLFYELISKSC